MLRRVATICGIILVTASFYFIFAHLWDQKDKLQGWHPEQITLYAVFSGIFIYAFACFFLAIAWEKLLHLFGQQNIDSTAMRSIYARSQIAKYIPGNILHIASRHIMGRNLNIDHAVLTMAAVYEIIGLLTAAASLGLLGVWIFGVAENVFGGIKTISLLLLIVGIVFITGYKFIPLLLNRYKNILNISEEKAGCGLFSIYVCYLIFFLLSGAILVTLVNSFSTTLGFSGSAMVLSSFALSWIVGFLTPGAPAGVGIREAIIILTLDVITTSSNALIIAILFRMVTVLGDVLFLVIAVATDRLQKNH